MEIKVYGKDITIRRGAQGFTIALGSDEESRQLAIYLKRLNTAWVVQQAAIAPGVDGWAIYAPGGEGWSDIGAQGVFRDMIGEPYALRWMAKYRPC